jgi:hypothetical protein
LRESFSLKAFTARALAAAVLGFVFRHSHDTAHRALPERDGAQVCEGMPAGRSSALFIPRIES